jgi:hypothetical protein
VAKHKKKKRAKPEHPPDPAAQLPEAAFPESAVQAALAAPAAATPLRLTSDKVALPPGGVGSSRDRNFWFGVCGIVGMVASCIALPLALYLYQASKVKPLLTFGVHPLKTELQRPDQDKDLGFIYRGKPVDSESITSVQVSIWNAGTRSIWDRDVLEPIRLLMPDGAAILSVRVKKTSRPICEFEHFDDQEGYKSGTCRLKWRILEPSDGAVLQIIYAGNARSDPKVAGAVEGQSDGIVVEKFDLSDDRKVVVGTPRFWPILGVVLIIGMAISLVFVACRIGFDRDVTKQMAEVKAASDRQLAELRKRVGRSAPLFLPLLACALILLLAALVLLFRSSFRGPPFGW